MTEIGLRGYSIQLNMKYYYGTYNIIRGISLRYTASALHYVV